MKNLIRFINYNKHIYSISTKLKKEVEMSDLFCSGSLGRSVVFYNHISYNKLKSVVTII